MSYAKIYVVVAHEDDPRICKRVHIGSLTATPTFWTVDEIATTVAAELQNALIDAFVDAGRPVWLESPYGEQRPLNA